MATYIRLIDYKDPAEKEAQFSEGKNRYVTENRLFNRIPGGLYAYWITAKTIENFEKGELGKCVSASVGIQTGDNDLFLRYWWEISQIDIKYDAQSVDDSFQDKKWFPYNKGGEYRKWYGNDFMVVNWKNDGADVKKNSEDTGHHYQQYADSFKFKPHVTWSRISTGTPAFRIKGYGYLSDMAGFSLYCSEEELPNILSFCNSCVAEHYLDFLAPTLNIMTGPVLSLPYDADEVSIKESVSKAIELSKADWDDFEVSWNYKKHPLV